MTDMSILVPLDGSLFAEKALGHAIGVAASLGARLELVSVAPALHLIAVGDPAVASIPPSVLEEEKWRLEEYLVNVREKLASFSNCEIDTVVLEGDVPQTIEGHVANTRPSMIVMSSHGRGALSRLWLGSVADQLVRHANVPVLIVKPNGDADGVEEDWEAAKFNKILVPVDGSPLSKEGLDWAVRFIGTTETELHLAWNVQPQHVYESPYFPGVSGAVPVLPDGIAEDLARTGLRKLRDESVPEGLPTELHVLTGPSVATGILDCVDGIGADLIVMATHGRGGLARATLGSVADKVVRGATVPVLLMKGHGES